MKKDIFDLRLGESKVFDRAQSFYYLYGEDIMLSQTYGVWYTTWKKEKHFFLKNKAKRTSRRWSWSIQANHVFSTLEDAKIGVKHKLIKKYEDLLEQRKKDIVRFDGLLSDPNNFNVIDIKNKSYCKNRWETVIKFREEQRLATS